MGFLTRRGGRVGVVVVVAVVCVDVVLELVGVPGGVELLDVLVLDMLEVVEV